MAAMEFGIKINVAKEDETGTTRYKELPEDRITSWHIWNAIDDEAIYKCNPKEGFVINFSVGKRDIEVVIPWNNLEDAWEKAIDQHLIENN